MGRGKVRGGRQIFWVGAWGIVWVESIVVFSTANAEQTYFAIRGGKAKRGDAASVVEAASVCGGKSHFAVKLRICPRRHAAISDMMPSRCAS
ncbi:hypothetical protein DPMN_098956 [Dreissena polymorpha]|uniref:Uncharacterized protein n=1 Tax=Dreissena polymorpha TaxID=45954 RepID=A0A9D4LEL9_DREPO|nr:hypothetical protein DPMN_098956 [Dreissena polymorpha]